MVQPSNTNQVLEVLDCAADTFFFTKFEDSVTYLMLKTKEKEFTFSLPRPMMLRLMEELRRADENPETFNHP